MKVAGEVIEITKDRILDIDRTERVDSQVCFGL